MAVKGVRVPGKKTGRDNSLGEADSAAETPRQTATPATGCCLHRKRAIHRPDIGAANRAVCAYKETV
jgi:hypothetical protein